ncbi:MAG: hypothetical protein H0T53_11655, partial [Herpetosiphonaceae bacterium]|nr:hypothetical protein [Herpetosiphonaceae bacterium]
CGVGPGAFMMALGPGGRAGGGSLQLGGSLGGRWGWVDWRGWGWVVWRELGSWVCCAGLSGARLRCH